MVLMRTIQRPIFAHFRTFEVCSTSACTIDRNKQKSEGPRSGEYGGCVSTSQDRSFNILQKYVSVHVMQPNYLSMPVYLFLTFINQTFLQLDYLVLVAIRINSFIWFQKIIVHDTLLIRPNTQHYFLSKSIWSCCLFLHFTWINPWFCAFLIFKINLLFISRQNSM